MQVQPKIGQFRYYPLVGSVNAYLIDVLNEIQLELPELQRISFAVYNPKKDSIKTCADSASNSHEFMHYEQPLIHLPSLQQSKQSRSLRVIDNLPHKLNRHSRHNQWLLKQKYCSSLVMPIFNQDTFIGFLFCNASVSHYFSQQILERLQPYFSLIQDAICRDYAFIQHLIEQVHQVEAHSTTHSQHTKAHKERIGRYARIIAQEVAQQYALDNELIDLISRFATCHDLGKLNLPHELLQQSSPLSNSERKLIDSHIESGVDLLNDIVNQLGTPHHSCLAILREIMAYQYEFLDGSGYPFGLNHDQIPIPARIVSVANIFDALTTHRPYKQARSIPHALLELEIMVSHGKLDPHCLNALRNHQDTINTIIQQFPEHDPKNALTH